MFAFNYLPNPKQSGIGFFNYSSAVCISKHCALCVQHTFCGPGCTMTVSGQTYTCINQVMGPPDTDYRVLQFDKEFPFHYQWSETLPPLGAQVYLAGYGLTAFNVTGPWIYPHAERWVTSNITLSSNYVLYTLFVDPFVNGSPSGTDFNGTTCVNDSGGGMFIRLGDTFVLVAINGGLQAQKYGFANYNDENIATPIYHINRDNWLQNTINQLEGVIKPINPVQPQAQSSASFPSAQVPSEQGSRYPLACKGHQMPQDRRQPFAGIPCLQSRLQPLAPPRAAATGQEARIRLCAMSRNRCRYILANRKGYPFKCHTGKPYPSAAIRMLAKGAGGSARGNGCQAGP